VSGVRTWPQDAQERLGPKASQDTLSEPILLQSGATKAGVTQMLFSGKPVPGYSAGQAGSELPLTGLPVAAATTTPPLATGTRPVLCHTPSDGSPSHSPSRTAFRPLPLAAGEWRQQQHWEAAPGSACAEQRSGVVCAHSLVTVTSGMEGQAPCERGLGIGTARNTSVDIPQLHHCHEECEEDEWSDDGCLVTAGEELDTIACAASNAAQSPHSSASDSHAQLSFAHTGSLIVPSSRSSSVDTTDAGRDPPRVYNDPSKALDEWLSNAGTHGVSCPVQWHLGPYIGDVAGQLSDDGPIGSRLTRSASWPIAAVAAAATPGEVQIAVPLTSLDTAEITSPSPQGPVGVLKSVYAVSAALPKLAPRDLACVSGAGAARPVCHARSAPGLSRAGTQCDDTLSGVDDTNTRLGREGSEC
jgi:hypothetical protein